MAAIGFSQPCEKHTLRLGLLRPDLDADLTEAITD